MALQFNGIIIGSMLIKYLLEISDVYTFFLLLYTFVSNYTNYKEVNELETTHKTETDKEPKQTSKWS